MQIFDKKNSLNSVLSKCIEHFWHLTGKELQAKTNHFVTELLNILSADNLIINSTYENELFINYLAYNYYITHIGDNYHNTHFDKFAIELKIPLFDISNNKCLKVRLTIYINEDNSLNVDNLRVAFLDYNGDSNSLQFLKNKHAKTLKNRYQFINNEQIQNANNFKNFNRHVKKYYRKHFKKNTFINFNIKIVRGNTAGYKYPRINIVYNHSSLSKILKNNLHSQLNITSDNLSNIIPYDDDSTESVSIQNSLPNYQKLIDLNLIDYSRIKQLNKNKRIIQKILKNHNFNSYAELYFDEKKDSILATDEIELLIYIPLNNVIFIIKTPMDFQKCDINTLDLHFSKDLSRRIHDSFFSFQDMLNNPEEVIKLIEMQEY